ncbi:hypothetical protein HHI36_006195, partial [Cryptolaemus montrouzieri]
IIASKEEIVNSVNEIISSKDERCCEEIVTRNNSGKTQEGPATKLEIQNEIDPSTLGVEVTKVKHTRNGGVAISCTNKEDVKNISENIKEQLGEDYEIQIPIRKNRKIRIRNLKRTLNRHKK